jgi:hypothetical protein
MMPVADLTGKVIFITMETSWTILIPGKMCSENCLVKTHPSNFLRSLFFIFHGHNFLSPFSVNLQKKATTTISATIIHVSSTKSLGCTRHLFQVQISTDFFVLPLVNLRNIFSHNGYVIFLIR